MLAAKAPPGGRQKYDATQCRCWAARTIVDSNVHRFFHGPHLCGCGYAKNHKSKLVENNTVVH